MSLAFCLCVPVIGSIGLFKLALAATMIGLVLGARFANQSYRLKEEKKQLIRGQGKALLER